jgi:tetratricopeptide (TPR) repeat protein
MWIMQAEPAELTKLSAQRRRPRVEGGAILVGLCCIAVQLTHLAGAVSDPTFEVAVVDAGVYHDAAMRFAEGERLIDDAFWQPPLFPLLLGVLYRLAGPDVALARCVLAAIAVSSCLLVWWIGRQVFSRRVGLLAGLVAAVYGPFVFFSTRLLPTGLAVLLVLAALVVLIRCLHRPRWYDWLLFGLLAGLATITVANAGVLVLIGLITAIVSGREGRTPAGSLAVCLSQTEDGRRRHRPLWPQGVACIALAIGAAIPIGSVTIRNYRACGEWVILSTNGGINFYIGNNPQAEETVAIRPGAHWKRLARKAQTDRPRTRAEQSSYFLRRGLAYAADQPLDFLRGLGRKTLRLINAREIPRNVDPYVHREFSPVLRVLLWRAGPFGFPFGLMAPLALVGVFATLSRSAADGRRAGRVALLGFTAAYGASIVVFFVTSRYRLPMAVAMIPFSAAGAAWIWDQLRHGDPSPAPLRSRLAAAVAFATAAIAVNLPIRAATDGVDFQAELAMSVGHAYTARGELDRAEEHFRHALELNPTYPASAAGLADMLVLSGRPDEAEALLRNAITWDASSAETRRLLGQLLHTQGRNAEALAAFNDALDIDPTSPEAHAGLADVLVASGRVDEAIRHYEEAVELIDEPGPVLIRLGDALAQVSRYEEAIERYRQGLWQVEPEPAALNRIAWLLATCPVVELRDCERAIEIAEHLCRVTEYEHPVAMDTLAAAYAECGRLADAITWAQRAIDTAVAAGDGELAESFRPRLRIYEERLGQRRP